MAILKIISTNQEISNAREVTTMLASVGIDYERWENIPEGSDISSDEEILEAYSAEIERLKVKGGYVMADVINIIPTTPNLDEMLGRFNKEHWHDEDEVRFIVNGRGLFHIVPPNADVVSIEMEAGDLIRVPKGTRHWFNLCGDRTVRAIRLFQDFSGWAPQYTESGIDGNYQPLCFGAAYIPGKF